MAIFRPNLFSIAPGVPFLPTLADAILDGTLVPDWSPRTDPLALSRATLFLPTRRAARALNTLLAQRSGGSVLLPRIVPLGDVDEAEDNIVFSGGAEGFGSDGTLPPEADPTFRRLMLAQLVLKWSDQVRMRLADYDPDLPLPDRVQDAVRLDPQGFIVATTARDALSLADALGRLIDSLTIHNKSWDELHKLVPSEFDQYWLISRDFVQIAAEAWPELRRTEGVMDASERRHKLILAEAERLKLQAPDAPFIVAGSTGSMPATARLIAAIAGLPRGAVVLPGLDLHLDEPSWSLLTKDGGEPGHPQALLAALLKEIGAERDDLKSLGHTSSALTLRDTFLSEVMRPAATTEAWLDRSRTLPDSAITEALAGVRIVEADDERDEALAIATLLRETLEEPGKIAALVTPDRTLAERVSADLARWGIAVEDSAGLALGRSSAGRLLRLAADAVAADCSATSLLALLDHPLAQMGLSEDIRQRGRNALEIGLLRGPAIGAGFAALRKALIVKRQAKEWRQPRPEKRLEEADWSAASVVLDRLAAIFAPFDDLQGAPRIDLLGAVKLLESVILGLVSDAEGQDVLDNAEGGEDIATLFDDLRPSEALSIDGRISELPGFLDGLMAGRNVVRRGASHPRIRIWGLLEARLLPSDRLVMGGLDEAVWPPATRTDPFLSRAFAEALSLPAPERRIGQTAHDFAQAFGAEDVIITRAAKRGGDPTVPSRFLQRMRAVAGKALYDDMIARGSVVLGWARSLDQLEVRPTPITRPAPVPEKRLLPTGLRITAVETLRRDPYSIYAKSVLKLDPLDKLARPPSAAELGTATHDAIGDFGKAYPVTLPADAFDTLIELGRKHFEPVKDQPEFSAFWWPRYTRSAQWLVTWEQQQRKDGTEIRAEIDGSHEFKLPSGGTFSIHGRADRIEIHPASRFSVVDYKTGQPPSAKAVKCGFSPQLTITAALIARGGFKDSGGSVVKGQVQDLLYVKLGGREGGKATSIIGTKTPSDPQELSEKHWAEFVKLTDQFINHGRGFASRPYVQFQKAHGDYDHLARVKEWSVTSDEEGGEE